ncbi:UDP-N-acetylglucosamine--N-acetylmuramyl-(pentapeptide) pyrophosphoryl-undecaprenol N-acetylglucosamine transferase [Alphaproteobacteria bacterium]|nr:UDP-N-acetylglucosamine--N-acetylmuramyl-(pentapeptide) pyrophosphoryl-undecaprenol N-acetylglucosamine transferase [Alphaproteobacteria bacterium]
MNIIIAAGGTGGHVFPAVCVANELKKHKVCVRFVSDERGKKYLADYENSAIIQRINTSSRFKLYISLLKNTLLSFSILKRDKPLAIIGFGGYPAVPCVLAAQILRKKTVIFEQNAVVGGANKMLSKFSSLIVTAFENTKNLKQSDKLCFIGNPTRFESIYDKINDKKNDKFTILIIGGSQGAQIFSQIEEKLLTKIENDDIIICRQAAGGFFANIEELYQQTDLVIARSGAATIFELIGFHKPAILVPYKKSINGDQLENALFLSRNNAAITIDESEINKVPEIVSELMQNTEKIENMKENLRKLYRKNITEKAVAKLLKVINT